MDKIFRRQNGILEFIYFGNYFYGICAVALSVEASLQQHYPLNDIPYYALVFISTVLYYSHPYIHQFSITSDHSRTFWYRKHYRLMFWSSTDCVNRLKTFVVRMGQYKTLLCIAIPLSLASVSFLLYYGLKHQFHPARILLNTIPFVWLVFASLSLPTSHSLLYYLVLIEGLILVTAACGCFGIFWLPAETGLVNPYQ